MAVWSSRSGRNLSARICQHMSRTFRNWPEIASRACSCLCAFAAVVLLFNGCAGLKHRGPVADDVMRAREFSQYGMDALQHGRWQDAERNFAESLQHCPENVPTRRHLANCLWQRGAKQDAIRVMTETLGLCPHADPEIMVHLGEMHLEVRNLDAAEQLANDALQQNSSYGPAWRLKASVAQGRGEHADAITAYYRALAYDPHDRQSQFSVAEAYHHLGRHDRVVASLNRLESMGNGDLPNAQVLRLKGNAFVQLERYHDAIPLLQSLCELNDSEVSDLLLLAEAQRSAGMEWESKQSVQRALASVDPRDRPELQQYLSRLTNGSEGASPGVRR